MSDTANSYQRLRARYERLLEISRQLNSSLDLTTILNLILSAASELTNTKAVSIMLIDPATGELRFVAAHDPEGMPMGAMLESFVVPMEGSIAGWVVTHGEHQVVEDAQADPRFFGGVDKKTRIVTRNLLAVPLKAHDEIIGVVEALNRIGDQPWTEEDIQILQALANQSAIAIQTARYFQAEIKQQRIEKELAIAQRIQSTFMPTRLPQPRGWEIAAYFQPAREVSGDFYDVFELPNNRVGFVVADVCDKGVGAALFMSLSRSLIRAFGRLDDLCYEHFGAENLTASVSQGYFPAIALTNNYIAENHGDMAMFVTLFFGMIFSDSNHMFYINAGHNPPAIVDARGQLKARLSRTGPAVGAFPDMEFGIGEVTFEPGDTLVAFTDGVTDARNSDKQGFGEKRLLALIADPDPSAHDLIERIVANVRGHIGDAAQFDDITMVAVRRSA